VGQIGFVLAIKGGGGINRSPFLSHIGRTSRLPPFDRSIPITHPVPDISDFVLPQSYGPAMILFQTSSRGHCANSQTRAFAGLFVCALLMQVGCGTTHWSDTTRTGTEQLVITGAIEQSVSEISFDVLRGQKVFLDAQYLEGVTDKGFLISTLRQQMVAQGVVLKSDVKEADYVVEARAMTGTNRTDLLFGVPQTTLPNLNVPGVPASIPELSLAKSTTQKGIAKVAVFAYEKESGTSIWQSGSYPVASTAKHMWLMGTGPWQQGSIYNGTQFAGTKLNPYHGSDDSVARSENVTSEKVFEAGQELAEKQDGGYESKTRQVDAKAGEKGKAAQLNGTELEFDDPK